MPLEQRRRQREILSSGWCRNKRRKLSGKCKSKRYIIMGACFSCLHPFSSFIIFFPKETILLLSVCLPASLFMCWEVGSCELVYVRCLHISWEARTHVQLCTHGYTYCMCECACFLLEPVAVGTVYPCCQTPRTISCVILLCNTCADLFKTRNRNSVFSFDLDDALLTHLCVQVAFLFFLLQSECSSMTQIKPHHLSTHPTFFPFHFPPISLPSLFPPHDTAVLAGLWWGFRNGNEMHGMVALCQRAADWTLAWMVQQMFADFFYSN